MTLLLCAAGLGGCEVLGFVAQGLNPDRVKAMYPIADLPTLVLVEDPQGKLPDPTLPGLIADRVAADLRQAQVVTEFISPVEVRNLEAQLGREFARTPVDRIGKAVGAQQVIHILVESLEMNVSGDMVRPKASVRVKLIDAAQSRRLFPAATTAEVERGAAPSPLGYPVEIEMFYQRSQEARGSVGLTLRRVANSIGRDVARLFHDHDRRPVGDGFED